jgi:NAD(P)-dependent dehydrogenase (short-subunit alcohol dehydrogenase family)
MTGLLITGGSGGIGAALARVAAAQGRSVVIGHDRGKARAEALRAEICGSGGRAETAHLPLHDPAALAAALSQRDDAPDTLALCGWPAPAVAPFTRQRAEDFAVQQAALLGCHALIAGAWRLWWRKRGGGHVVAVLTSGLGPPAAPHMASYIAGKGALQSLLDAAAAELGPAGLRISTLSPGYVETPMLASFDARLLDRARQSAPGGAFLSPQTVAATLMSAIETPPAPGAVHRLAL